MEDHLQVTSHLLALPLDVLVHVIKPTEVKDLRALMGTCRALCQLVLTSGRLKHLKWTLPNAKAAPSGAAWGALVMACQHAPQVHLVLAAASGTSAASKHDALARRLQDLGPAAAKVTGVTLQGWDVGLCFPPWRLLTLFRGLTQITIAASCTAYYSPSAAKPDTDLLPLSRLQQLHIHCGVSHRLWESWQPKLSALTGLQRFTSEHLPPLAVMETLSQAAGQTLRCLEVQEPEKYDSPSDHYESFSEEDRWWDEDYSLSDDESGGEDNDDMEPGQQREEEGSDEGLLLCTNICIWFPQLRELGIIHHTADDDDDLDALLLHPCLRYVRMGDWHLSADHAQQACRWKALGWMHSLSVSSVPKMPLHGIRRLVLGASSIGRDADCWVVTLDSDVPAAAHMAAVCAAVGGLQWLPSSGPAPARRAGIMLNTTGGPAALIAFLPVLASYDSALPTSLRLSGLRQLTAAGWQLVVEQLQQLPWFGCLHVVQLHACQCIGDVWPVLLQGLGRTLVVLSDSVGPVTEQHLQATIQGAPRHARLSVSVSSHGMTKGWVKRLKAAAAERRVEFQVYSREERPVHLPPPRVCD